MSLTSLFFVVLADLFRFAFLFVFLLHFLYFQYVRLFVPVRFPAFGYLVFFFLVFCLVSLYIFSWRLAPSNLCLISSFSLLISFICSTAFWPRAL